MSDYKFKLIKYDEDAVDFSKVEMSKLEKHYNEVVPGHYVSDIRTNINLCIIILGY